jgi:hypothetical protein
MPLDPTAVVVAIVVLVAFVLLGSRIFPEDLNVLPWRGAGQRDRPAAGVQEDDDVRFNWGPGEREDDDESGGG